MERNVNENSEILTVGEETKGLKRGDKVRVVLEGGRLGDVDEITTVLEDGSLLIDFGPQMGALIPLKRGVVIVSPDA